MRNALVGLTGKKRAGKDTAALILLQEGFERVAFADALRQMLYTLNPLVADGYTWQQAWDTEGYDVMKFWPEVRRLMQVFGTEVMRKQFGADVWVDLAMKQSATYMRAGTGVVFTDVRFNNEAAAILGQGGRVIEILRPAVEDGDQHLSEAGVSMHLITDSIYNNGTIADLHDNIRKVIPQ